MIQFHVTLSVVFRLHVLAEDDKKKKKKKKIIYDIFNNKYINI